MSACASCSSVCGSRVIKVTDNAPQFFDRLVMIHTFCVLHNSQPASQHLNVYRMPAIRQCPQDVSNGVEVGLGSNLASDTLNWHPGEDGHVICRPSCEVHIEVIDIIGLVEGHAKVNEDWMENT